MVAKQITRYVLQNTDEAKRFCDGVANFYSYGAQDVSIKEDGDTIVVEYAHLIETKDTIFGDKR